MGLSCFVHISEKEFEWRMDNTTPRAVEFINCFFNDKIQSTQEFHGCPPTQEYVDKIALVIVDITKELLVEGILTDKNGVICRPDETNPIPIYRKIDS